jgi:hypothetical protein
VSSLVHRMQGYFSSHACRDQVGGRLETLCLTRILDSAGSCITESP